MRKRTGAVAMKLLADYTLTNDFYCIMFGQSKYL